MNIKLLRNGIISQKFELQRGGSQIPFARIFCFAAAFTSSKEKKNDAGTEKQKRTRAENIA